MAKSKPASVAKSAVSGKFVTARYGKSHPSTTFVQTVKKGK